MYSDGFDYIRRLIDNDEQDKTYTAFSMIGIDVLYKVLHGTYGCQQTAVAIGQRIANSDLFCSKLEDAAALA